MLRKLFAFILLLNHLNTSMFIPQVDEQDVFDKNGVQVDDINSVVEYVDEVVLNNKDNTPEDEDDDTAKSFHVSKLVDHCYQLPIAEVTENPFTEKIVYTFDPYKENKVSPVYTSVISPPPDALS